MRVETAHFAFDLPDGFVVQPADDVWSALREADAQELTVSAVMAKEEAPIDEALGRLAKLRGDALRKTGATHVSPVVYADQGDVRIAWFVAAGLQPLMSYCAIVADRHAVMGQRCIVSLCLYQSFQPGGGAPDGNAFVALGSRLMATLNPLPQRALLERAVAQAATATDMARLYPYVVPLGYLASRPLSAPDPPAIGHGLFLALAEDFEGVARVQFPEKLASLGAPDLIVQTAKANLAGALEEQRVTIEGFEGPRGLPVMVFGRHWLAASCLLLPDLHAFAGRHLGAGPLCASVPHRNVMLVFRQEDAAYRAEMQALIARNEAGAPKPLTAELFAVRPNGIEPMDA